MDVFVGPQRKKWAIHEKLLTSQSEYFRLAIGVMDRGRPGDASGSGNIGSDSIELPDDDPKLFAMAVRWLYGITFAGRCEFPKVDGESSDVTVRDYMGLYVLASKLVIEGLKNASISVVYDYFHAGVSPGDKRRCPDLRDVRFVFDNTVEDSQMRHLLIVSTLFYLFGRKDRTILSSSTCLPTEWEEVLRSRGDIAWELIKMMGTWNWVIGGNCPNMRVKGRCYFHDHTGDSVGRCED